MPILQRKSDVGALAVAWGTAVKTTKNLPNPKNEKMAEAFDVLFDVLHSAEDAAQDGENGSVSGSQNVERFNLSCLAAGKLLDLAADWAIVVNVLAVSLAISGCVNTCKYSSDFICQDGAGKTTTSSDIASCYRHATLDLLCLGGNLTMEDSVCDYGTDCEDCGPREPLASSPIYPIALKCVAIVVALLGTGIEVYAGYRKLHLQYDDKIHTSIFWSRTYQRLVGHGADETADATNNKSQHEHTVYMIKSLNLNRQLVPWRFALDDLPATVLSIYILSSFPDQANLATIVLLVTSVIYSVFAMLYHFYRSFSGQGDAMFVALYSSHVTILEIKECGVTDLTGAFKAGYSLRDALDAGYDYVETVKHFYLEMPGVDAFMHKVGSSLDRVTTASTLDWANKSLTGADCEVLVYLAAIGALASCQLLNLRDNKIGDAGMQALAGAVSKGALASCQQLFLGNNQITDVGLSALASACASGALPQLNEANVYLGGNPGNAELVKGVLRERKGSK